MARKVQTKLNLPKLPISKHLQKVRLGKLLISAPPSSMQVIATGGPVQTLINFAKNSIINAPPSGAEGEIILFPFAEWNIQEKE